MQVVGRAAVRLGVVGINLPTFVERRSTRTASPSSPGGVVGINLPTFVERSASPTTADASRWVSSGLTSRPSLSGSGPAPAPARHRVSSGLTSRPSLSVSPSRRPWRLGRRVSSGLTSRPSLSVQPHDRVPVVEKPVSSGLTSRPSLSGYRVVGFGHRRSRVVGINLPTFVERNYVAPSAFASPKCRRD